MFLTAFKQEYRRLEFLNFVSAGGDLDLIVAMLVLLRRPLTKADLALELHMRLGYPRNTGVLHQYMGWLEGQFLVERVKKKECGFTMFRAAPSALDEFQHQLTHDGHPRPPKTDRTPARVAKAQQAVKRALHEAGWRSGEGRRLRIVDVGARR